MDEQVYKMAQNYKESCIYRWKDDSHLIRIVSEIKVEERNKIGQIKAWSDTAFLYEKGRLNGIKKYIFIANV